MDILPHIREVPGAVMLERFLIFLACALAIWMTRLPTLARSLLGMLFFVLCYLSLYATWDTFVLRP